MRYKFLIVFFIFWFGQLYSEPDSTKAFHFLQQRSDIDLNPISINPDAPIFKMSQTGGKWENMLGTRFGLFQYGKKHKIGLNAEGFVELYDFMQNEPMSWQMWRASFGLEAKAIFEISKKIKLAPSFAWVHESDHVTDVNGYEKEFLYPNWGWPYYGEANPQDLTRSFEYYRIGLEANWKPVKKFEIGLILNSKLFPTPAMGESIYKLNYGFSGELILTTHLFSFLDIYGATFYEQVANDFNSQETRFINTMVYQSLMSWYSELGVSLIGEKRNRMSLFVRYRNSYGRGMDFIQFYREWGMGVKIHI